MENTRELKIAVLIDADNVPYANVKGMLEEVAIYGTPTFKRIYGDWTKPTLSGWKTVLLENAITPVQQYSYTSGKNSSDSALIIDAMDILYTGRVDGFCIVSSDSDFTRLATRLREAGMQVFGIGEKKTPAAFIAACNKFIYIEILKKETKADTPAKETSKSTPAPKEDITPVAKIDKGLVKLISESINDIADEDGWIFLGVLGNMILKKRPDFDPRNYGHKKLLDLIRSIKAVEVEERHTGKNNASHFYVKTK
ncbi:NYN domain-containing protein [Dyadobacter psychrotolerans]|uniref:NYN domain-containing protein n=1 Tax=Dyadobacter psychrotolerans TaxID=2541721 RepID=A0A4R5DKC2_9BACT|nr:NYN domain-containing protein [Dyadobacter psychrotolerans]TDE14616.1 NYN domain-containing protein [Dyadobacter psychrotolerans]